MGGFVFWVFFFSVIVVMDFASKILKHFSH